MKLKTWIPLATLMLTGVVQGATNDLTGLLQKGLFEEEANRDLSAAISNYQSLANAFDRDRQLAGTAIFRLGECYRKLGKTNEAVVQYERIVREFGDQQTLVTLSRQNLAGLGATSQNPSTPAEGYNEVLAALKQRREAEQVLTTDEEEKEIRSIQAMIQNSPDLINAPSGDPRMTPLARAASQDQLRVARFLLDAKADVNQKSGGMTPLQQAASRGHRAMAELLLNTGADVDVKGTSGGGANGQTALHFAAEHGFISVMNSLLAAKADVNAQDELGNTPLTRAVQNGFRAAAELLLSHGADPNLMTTRKPEGWGDSESGVGAPLHFAVLRGDEATTALLLSNRADTELRSPSPYDKTALDIAAEKGTVEIARRLLEAGASPNPARGNSNEPTALFRAVKQGSSNMVSLLLAKGADPNVTSYNDGAPGMTPLMVAVLKGSEQITLMLLRNKADPNLKNDSNWTAFSYGLSRPGAKCLTALLDYGVDPNHLNGLDDSPLMGVVRADTFASPAERTSVAKLLIAKGADVNAKHQDGNTALHLAVAYNRPELVELLIASKADVNAQNNQGQTPLGLTKEKQTVSGNYTILNIPPGPSIPRSGLGIRPGPPVQQAQAPVTETDLAALLRQHGAVDELPDFSAIRVTRQGVRTPIVVFRQNSNDWNQVTLLETIFNYYYTVGFSRPGRFPGDSVAAVQQTAKSGTFPFPDLGTIIIHRPSHTAGGKVKEITVSFLNAPNGVDCTKDVPLEFGDVVEIPQREHALSEPEIGLSPEQTTAIGDCLRQHARLVVRGQSRGLELLPNRYLSFQLGLPEAKNFLLSSSDLTRVKVTRKNPATGKAQEFVEDTTKSTPPQDLWLRDGDVIEVPEK